MRNGKKTNFFTAFRVTKTIHSKVVEHCSKTGGTFGSFYERAAVEKIEREKENEKLLEDLKNQKN